MEVDVAYVEGQAGWEVEGVMAVGAEESCCGSLRTLSVLIKIT